MSNSTKTHELIRQNEKIVKKSQKHDANLQKNSTLYFQVGLILCLLGAYSLFEMEFETQIPEVAKVLEIDDYDEVSIDNFKVYEEPKAEVKPKTKKKVLLIDEPKIVDDDHVIKETLGIDTPEQNTTSDPVVDPNALNVIDVPEPDDVPFTLIEKVPVYPGCESKKTNDAKRKCMSDKITKLVQRKFDTNLGGELGLSGKQVIHTQFKIDKTGHVIDIKTRATHPDLEKEAERVINKIPEMTPGKQRDKNVGVIYNLPIIFQVHN